MASWLGYGSVTHALAYGMRAASPERAHTLAPRDGRITSLLSERVAGPQGSVADRVRADMLAQSALRQDATAVPAAATLGVDALIRGDMPSARRWFRYSQRLSRRDLRTRLAAIEDSVARGDIAGTLRNYDIALRTSRLAPDLLFPVMSAAIADPQIRTGLLHILKTRPAWAAQWTIYVSGNGPDARDAAALFLGMDRAGMAAPQDTRSALVRRLVSQGAVEDAWSFYAGSTRGADRRRSRDPRFAATLDVPSPFDWQVVQDDSASSSIQRGESGGIFDFAVSPGNGGPLLRQMQVLPAGRYTLQGRSQGIDQHGASLPYWILACSTGQEIGRVVVPASTVSGGRFAGSLTVPAGCPVQYLTLVARPSDAISGVTGQITQTLLRPAT